jgi:drug/metabolite transporter (DMT)-like permease
MLGAETWLILAISAQVFGAGVVLIDKYIVSDERVMPKPFVYAFITCLLSGASILLFAFWWVPYIVPIDGLVFPRLDNIEKPTLTVVAFSILGAYTFFSALTSMFTALKEADASDVVPVVGAVTAVATSALAFLFLGTRLSDNYIVGILLLAIGTALVSHFRFTYKTALICAHAGLFFALHSVTMKGLFELDGISFDNAFFWSRVGFVFFALSMLLVPDWTARVHGQMKGTGKRAGALVLLNKVLAGVASIMILKATELAPADDFPIIQALGGLQFVFILGIGLLIGHKTPQTAGENHSSVKEIIHKSLFVSIIVIGFFMLFV